MAIPAATVSVQDPGLGIAGAASTTPIFVGIASSGAVDTPTFFGSPAALVAAFGYGSGVEGALQALAYSGGPVGFCRINGSVAASNGSVTQSGAGPLPTLSGNALFDFSAKVQIVTGGTLGVATFRYTLDAAEDDSFASYTETITTPAGGAYVLTGSGVTITFIAGTYVAGEVYSFTCNSAGFAAADVTTALTACQALSVPWRHVHIIETANCGDETAGAALAAAAQSKLDAMATAQLFRAGIIGTTNDSTATGGDAVTAYAAVAANRLTVMHGLVGAVAQRTYPGRGVALLPASVPVSVRACGSLISTDLKRTAGDGLADGGPLPGVLWISWDERTDGGTLGDAKLGSLRTYQGRSGFWISEAPIKSAAGSDVTIWPRRLVLDVACETIHEVTVGFIGRGVRTNANGSIAEPDALRLESEGQSSLDARLVNARNAEGTGGHVSAVSYAIDRTTNIVATETIEGDVGVRPLGYAKFITTRVGFTLGGTAEEAAEAAEA